VDAPKPEHAPVFRVKFHDGPAAGVLKEYPREMQTIQYFAWTYDNLYRREGDYWLFAKRPNNRAVNRILPLVVKQQGRDPRLEPKRQPDRVVPRGRNEVCWCGSGKKYKKCHAVVANDDVQQS